MAQASKDYDLVGKGWTSTVYRVRHTSTAVKVVSDEKSYKYHEREKLAYARLIASDNPPASILNYFGESDGFERGLVLELAGKGNLYEYLWQCKEGIIDEPPNAERLVTWAAQAAEGFAFIHACGILHCDIHVLNLFLNDNLDLKIGDFGGSSIDGNRPLLLYRSTHQLWSLKDNNWQREISVLAEIFALGCAFYNIETRDDPFEDLDSSEQKDMIVQRLRDKEMPQLEQLSVLSNIINKCWQLQYQSMSEILQDVRQVQAQTVAP